MAKEEPRRFSRRNLFRYGGAAAVVAGGAVWGGTQTNWYGLGGDDPAPSPEPPNPNQQPTNPAPSPAGDLFRPDGGVPRFMAHWHALDESNWSPTTRDATGNKVAQPWLAAQLDGLQSLGVEGVRIDLGWSAIAKESNKLNWGTFHLHRLLEVQKMLAERGMSMILVPQRSPAWARPGTDPDNPNQLPTDMGAVTDFARQLVSKLDPNVVKAIEAWNEPNLGDFTGVPKEERPRRYAEFLTAFHGGVQLGIKDRATRGEQVKFPVIFAGPSRNDTAFLDACLALKPPCEALGAHPYMADQSLPADTEVGAIAEQYTRSYPSMREVAKRHGYDHLPHGLTEFGVSVHENEPGLEDQFRGATADVAVGSMATAFDLAQETDGSFVVYYVAHRPPSTSDDPARARHRAGMSLLNQDGRPLPHTQRLAAHVQQRRAEAGAPQPPRRTAANMPTPSRSSTSTAPTR